MPALSSNTVSSPPATATFGLSLSKAIEGTAPAFLPLDVKFSYNWDFSKNEGYATVLSIGSNHTVNQQMFPMGIGGKLAFMARERFDVMIKTKEGKEEDVYAYRVILNMATNAVKKEAAIMVGTEGDVIIATENWGAVGL
ncbi:hypothetical protein TWF694_002678 [Orbilia ellipsospora]|uniref:Uncharacterized protein n=1 Tax=Orbilia ellipsospora TaxID=2528407 RepID=A0AAV9X3Y0_9PEZI